jgi:aspartate ammonia-lyase
MARIEKDSLGEMELPDGVYYGIQTARAKKNIPVSGIRERPELIHAYVLVKKAAALSNMELGVLDRQRAEAIVAAADRVLTGKFDSQFHVDVYQAGAGTSFNMNVNEVVANLALEILGRPKGDYEYLSPNDHVNMAQSSNDTFPTAQHIAVIDVTVSLAAQAGQFELNVMTPVIAYNILQSIAILNCYLPVFTERCVMGIEADETRCRAYVDLNPSLATLLSPRLGYLRAAELAKEAMERKISVAEVAVEKGLITRKEAEEIFDPDKITRGTYDQA